MGYYSSVGLAVYKKDYLKMLSDARAEESRPGNITWLLTKACDHIGLVEQKDADKDVIVLRWDGIKWYDGFESIDFVNRWMDKADENETGYEFARCGEEIGDTETRYFDDGHILGFGDYVGVIHEVWLPNEGKTYEPPDIPEQQEETIEPIDIDGLLAADGA